MLRPFYWEAGGKCGHLETLELAKQAAEKALATAKKDGFYWEEVEQEFDSYLALGWSRLGGGQSYHGCETEARASYASFQNYSERSFFYGVKKTGEIVLLDPPKGSESEVSDE